MTVNPFTVHVADETLEDLRERLARTRWPGELPHTGWDYGSNLAYVKELAAYWQSGFDWRAQEAALNRFSHFRTTVDGMGIHFIHEKGKGPAPLPLVITHGWPSTVFEMSKIIPLLTDPAAHGGDPQDAFDVVAPSLPGYGFSDVTSTRGINVARIADLWSQLMTAIGYDRYGAHGGDWGAGVTARLGFSYGSQVIGIHTTSVSGVPTGWQPGMRDLTAAERTFLEARAHWQLEEGGYAHIQGTKPQTLSYGLNDSPAALAAWIVEKWRSWSDCDGDVERCFSKDELADHHYDLLGHADDQLLHPHLLREPAQYVDHAARAAHRRAVRRGALSQGNQPAATRVGRALLQFAAMVGNAARRSLCGL